MRQSGWLAIGGTLAAVTSAVVVGLHLSRPTVPRAYTWEPGGIALVDAPAHAAAALRAARPRLASWGHRPPDVVLGAPVEDCDGHRHAVTRGIASPTGHVLHPDLRRAGWSGAGIDGGTP